MGRPHRRPERLATENEEGVRPVRTAPLTSPRSAGADRVFLTRTQLGRLRFGLPSYSSIGIGKQVASP